MFLQFFFCRMGENFLQFLYSMHRGALYTDAYTQVHNELSKDLATPHNISNLMLHSRVTAQASGCFDIAGTLLPPSICNFGGVQQFYILHTIFFPTKR